MGRRGRVGNGVGVRVRVDVNEELKFLWKIQKKMGGGVRSRLFGGGVGLGGVRVDVNEELKLL